MKDDLTVARGSDNIFADLGVPDADEELFKARLVAVIRDLIEAEGLSQRAAAERMGIAQPDVSRLVRGRLGGFSLERLFSFVQALGRDIEVRVSTPKTRRVGHMIIEVA